MLNSISLVYEYPVFYILYASVIVVDLRTCVIYVDIFNFLNLSGELYVPSTLVIKNS